MMLENHLRHIKPTEFKRSVIWASRIGLFLLLIVTIVATIPFVAHQVKRSTVESTLRGRKQTVSQPKSFATHTFEFIQESDNLVTLPIADRRRSNFSASLGDNTQLAIFEGLGNTQPTYIPATKTFYGAVQ